VDLFKRIHRFLIATALVFVLLVTPACRGATSSNQVSLQPGIENQAGYAQLERGNTGAGQDFGSWVVQTSRGLVQDAYVRDNNKLGVVISPQVPPRDVRPLARSLVQGFTRSFPNKDVAVLMYAPDKQLILTAQYDARSQQIQYQ